MQIQFTGHHVEVTPAMRDLTTKKLERLQKHAHGIQKIEVVFEVEKLSHIAKATIHTSNTDLLFASAQADDMYKAIDDMCQKLSRQLDKHKDKF